MSLSSLLMGYGPLIDRDRRVMALQLRFSTLDGSVLRLSALYQALAAGRPILSQTLLVSAPAAEFDPAMATLEPVPGLWLEVPAYLAEQPGNQAQLLALHERGMALVLQGRPSERLPEALLPVFRLGLVDIHDERRQQLGSRASIVAGGMRRTIAVVQGGIRTAQEMCRAFEAGAYAVSGWVMPDTAGQGPLVDPADYAGVLQLLQQLAQGAPLPDIDALLRQDAGMAGRLQQQLDAVGFGLLEPVQDWQQLARLPGQQALRRCLLLMLVSINPDEDCRPLVQASLRRGLMLERLAGQEAEDTRREALFLLGLCSLLDRILGRPFGELLAELPLPEAVAQALQGRRGPYAGLLALVQAIEHGPDPALPQLLEQCGLSLAACNAALVDALGISSV